MDDQAGDLLVHYIRSAWVACNLKWDSDNESEVRQAIRLIVDAAVTEAAS